MYPVTAARCPLVIAHRGGGGEAPENSERAFEALRSLGIRHIETDAHVSADGVVVVNHDASVDRTFHAQGMIHDYAWNDLKRMEGISGQRMLALSEALEAFPDMYFNIDAKSDAVVDPLLEVIATHRAFHRVLIASFSEKRLMKVRALCPQVTTSLGTAAVVRLLAAAHTHSDAAAWGVPGPKRGVRAVQVPEYQGPIRVVDRRFVAAAHRAGLAVHVWTVNDEADMHHLLDIGVDGLVTDRPTLARQVLMERQVWRELPPPGHVHAPSRRPRD
ncbi:glycerophosphodiester phosphodiesterase [Schaalia sp. lx-100]|uniref:glycerophosphodiester phosphodiesterase n=1 Tax=Schaalia sp. lx-100 TaxID=2899081 RepID=UPI001E62CDBA|nr:glycerophosphodiester phosphodiesterase [Schaalia sp. lx-100]MCD4556731.1 glycerophosphodiester phosphodiesterase [Schaalia sp. lx-100]